MAKPWVSAATASIASPSDTSRNRPNIAGPKT